LGERFIRPLAVDRLCALIEPAMDEAHAKTRPGDTSDSDATQSDVSHSDEASAFARLEEGIQEFTRDISGAGFDVPAWLEALEQEVDRVLSDGPEEEELPDPQLPIVQVRLSREEVRRQVQALGGSE
jgi:hypothetical protein